jgi:hypothetical protein
VVQAAINRQPRALSSAPNFAPDAPVNRVANFCSDSLGHFFKFQISNFKFQIALAIFGASSKVVATANQKLFASLARL